MDQIEQKFQPSFIPKRQSEVKGMVSKAKRPTTLFHWIGVFAFVVSLSLSAMVFVYGKFVITKQLEERKLALKSEVEAFDTKLTNTLTTLKQRIDSGQTLLSKHISASALFLLLEGITAKNTYFNQFSFSALPGEVAKIEAKGEVSSFASLAFQSDTLNKSDFIDNVVFSDLNVNDKGKVVFKVEAEISPDLISYPKTVSVPEVSPNTNIFQNSGVSTDIEPENETE